LKSPCAGEGRPTSIIQNIIEEIFGNSKICGGERRRYGGTGRNSLF